MNPTVWSLVWPALAIGLAVYAIAFIILFATRRPAETSARVPDWVRRLESVFAFTAIGVGVLAALLIGFGVDWQWSAPVLVSEDPDVALQAWGVMAICIGLSAAVAIVYFISRRKQLVARRH